MAKTKAVKKEESTVSNRQEKSWGWIETIQEGEKHKVRRIFIEKGKFITTQSHEQKDLHWVVLSGFGNFKLEDIERFIGIGAHVSIPKKQKYSIFATKDLEFIEVQMGVCDDKDVKKFGDSED